MSLICPKTAACLSSIARYCSSSSYITPPDVITAAVLVLNEPDPYRKATLTNHIVADWQAGCIAAPVVGGSYPLPPERPARHSMRTVEAWNAPKRGFGSLTARQAMLHVSALSGP